MRRLLGELLETLVPAGELSLSLTTVEQSVAAPHEVVFDAVANIANLPDTHPDIVNVRFLSERRSGVGTRFVETRQMNGKEMETELEVETFAAYCETKAGA